MLRGVGLSGVRLALRGVAALAVGLVAALACSQPLEPLFADGGAKYGLAVQPVTNRIATTSGPFVQVRESGNGGPLVRTLGGLRGRAYSVAFSPDGSFLFAGDDSGRVTAWNASTFVQLWQVSTGSTPWRVLPDQAGSRLFVALNNGRVAVLNANTGAEFFSWVAHSGYASWLDLSPDGSLLATAGSDQTIKIWNTANYNLLRTISGHTASVEHVVFSPDGTRLLTGSRDNTARVWDVASGTQISAHTGHTNWVYAALWASNSEVVTGSYDRSIRYWNPANGALNSPPSTYHAAGIWQMAIIGGRVYSASLDRTIRVSGTDPFTGSDGTALRGMAALVRGVAHVDSYVLAGGADGLVWDYAMASSQLFDPSTGGTDALIESMNRARTTGDVFIGTQNGNLFYMSNGSFIGAPAVLHAGSILGVHSNGSDSDANKIVATAGADGLLRTFNYGLNLSELSVQLASTSLNAVAMSPDNTRIAAGGVGGLFVVNRPSGSVQGSVAPGWTVRSLAWSPAAPVIAAAGDGNVIRLYDANNLSVINELVGHTGSVRDVEFSPDGQFLYSVSADQTLRIWRVNGASLLYTSQTPIVALNSISVPRSPSDPYLAVAGDVVAVVRNPVTTETVPPETTILAPSNGSFTNQASVTVSWTGTDNLTLPANLQFEFRVNNGPWSGFSSGTSITEPFAEGSYTVQVRARDNAGNVDPTPASVTFTVDRTPPTLSDISLSGISFTAATVSWSLNEIADGRVQFGLTPAVESPSVVNGFQQNHSITLPSLQPNQTYFYKVVSTDRAGNSAESPVQSFTTLAPADLTVPSATAPVAVITDEAFSVSWIVRNLGPGVANGPWEDRVFLSADNQLDGGDTLLNGFNFTGSLGVNQQVQRSQDLSIGFDQVPETGNYFLLFVTDATNALPEFGNEGNNSFAAPIQVARRLLPDLQVTNLQAPVSAISGTQIQAQFTVTNTGAGATDVPEWTDYVFLSLDDQVGSDDVRAPISNITALNTSEGYVSTVTFTIPRGLVGAYNVIAFADGETVGGRNGLRESNEANNILSRPISLSVGPFPDLRVVRVQAPETALAGNLLDVSFRVQNFGTGPIPLVERGYVDGVYLSQDQVLSSDDIRIGERPQANNVLPGANYDGVVASMRIPVDLSGPYFVLVKTDDVAGAVNSQGRVWEFTFEQNNVGVSSFDNAPRPVNIIATPADLAVTEVTVSPISVLAGNNVTINWTVENEGPFAAGPEGVTWTDGVYLSEDNVFSPATDLYLGGRSTQGPINAGTTYDRSLTVQMPFQPTGNLTVFVYTDIGGSNFNGVVAETGDNANNLSSAALEVVPNASNLRIGQVSGPDTFQAGGSGFVTFRVDNLGPGMTNTSNWSDGIYLSTSSTALVNAVRIGGVPRGGALGANSSYVQQAFVSIPPSLSGQRFVWAVADEWGGVVETSDTDNGRSYGPVNIIALPGGGGGSGSGGPILPSDLVISGLTAPATVPSGAPASISWSVTNQGPNPVGVQVWEDAVFLSSDNVFSANDRFLGSQLRFSPLLVGQSYNASQNVNFRGVAPGLYTLFTITDWTNNVPESGNESNNLSSRSIQVIPADVDLAVEAVSAPASVVAGQAMNVSWTVRNLGFMGTFESAWTDYLYLSRDLVLDAGDAILGSRRQNGAVPALGSYSASLDVNAPATASGPYFVLVVTDQFQEATDISRLNNLRGSGLVGVQVPPPVDLTVTGVAAPPLLELGENASFSWTVRNIGANTVNGNWIDALYLSLDDTWDISDTLILRQNRSGPILPNGEYNATAEAEIPGLAPGLYRVLVRTDVRNTVRESLETNNAGASTGVSDVTVATLTLGEVRVSSIRTGQSKHFRVNALAGESLRWTASTPNPDDWLDAFIKSGEPARLSDFDLSGQPFTASQRVTVPETVAGFSYGLFRAAFLAGASPTPLTVKAEVVPFSIENVRPLRVGAASETTLTITGAAFRPGATAVLQGPVLLGLDVRYVSPVELKAVVRISGEPQLGSYTLVVTNPNGQSLSFPTQIVLEEAVDPVVEINFASEDPPRIGRPDTLVTQFRNIGNTDIPFATLSLVTAQPITFGFGANSRVLPDPTTFESPNWQRQVPFASTFAGVSAMSTVVRGFEVEEDVLLTTPLRNFLAGDYPVIAYLYSDSRESAAARAAWAGERLRLYYVTTGTPPPGFLAPFVQNATAWWGVLGARLVQIGYFTNAEIATVNPTSGFVPNFGIQSAAWPQYEALLGARMAATLSVTEANLGPALLHTPIELVALALSTTDGGGVGQIASTADLNVRFGNFQPPKMIRAYKRAPGNPIDPNDKLATPPKGPNQMVSGRRGVEYRINFENLPTAPAAASRVVIEDVLPSEFDPRTVRLSQITFGEMTIDVGGSAFYQRRLQLPPSMGNLIADVTAFVDLAQGRIVWILQAIDPNTGEPPNTTAVGLLPPENGTGRGQGYVTFSARSRPATPTGTLVSNTGTITFDEEAPIVTPAVTSRLDNSNPQSTASVTPRSQIVSERFVVSWSGTDIGSGVESYDVYVSIDGGPYRPWLIATTRTSAEYTGNVGSTYRFYSQARDFSGNLEPRPSTPDVTAVVVPNPTPAISKIGPSAAAVGSLGFLLSVQGSGYVPGAVVQWNGSPRPTTYLSSTALRAEIEASDLLAAGNVAVTVVNPGSPASRPAVFLIGAPMVTMDQQLLRDGNEIVATVTLVNRGRGPANNVSVQLGRLGNLNTSTSLPLSVGSMGPGEQVQFTVRFANAQPVGTRTTLRVRGTFVGGQFDLTSRVILP